MSNTTAHALAELEGLRAKLVTADRAILAATEDDAPALSRLADFFDALALGLRASAAGYASDNPGLSVALLERATGVQMCAVEARVRLERAMSELMLSTDDDSLSRECPACGADQGEVCRAGCIGHAAHLDGVGA